MGNRIARLSLWLLGGAIILQFVMPFIYPISAHDSFTHLNWIEQFCTLFREGNLYPRWMPQSFWGFGSPAFYFYPPLTYWCASVISFIVPNSPPTIYHILGILVTLLSSVTFYAYTRNFTEDKHAAWIGAIIYGVFPYRLLDLYLRNSIGEHLAFVFFPLIFLGIEMALQSSTKKKILITIAVSTIGWAGLLLSNIPTSIIAIYSVPIYSIIRAKELKSLKGLLSAIGGAIIGLMISAVYLLPINQFTSAIKVFHFWDFLVDESKTGIFIDFIHGRNRYFYVGLLLTFVIGLGLLIKSYSIRKDTVHKSIHMILLTFIFIAIGIQLPYLFFLLLNIAPFFRLIQFSFRWDILLVFAASLFVTLYYKGLQEQAAKTAVGFSALVTLIIGIGFYASVQSEHWQYKGLPEHIDVAEYLPLTANNDFELEKIALRSHAKDDIILPENESFRFHVLSVTPESIRFIADSSRYPTSVIFHRMFFPTWSLRTRSGMSVPLTSDSLGRINAVIPKIKEEYILAIEKSEIEKNGRIISLAGLSILALILLITIFLRNPKVS